MTFGHKECAFSFPQHFMTLFPLTLRKPLTLRTGRDYDQMFSQCMKELTYLGVTIAAGLAALMYFLPPCFAELSPTTQHGRSIKSLPDLQKQDIPRIQSRVSAKKCNLLSAIKSITIKNDLCQCLKRVKMLIPGAM